MPLISVVVPVYKTERYIRQCVDSIINQTFEDYEVILVDDGSPDGCPAICDAYAAEHERIRVIHKENGGSVSARKTGSLAAIGQYILAIDSDDFLREDYLQGFADAIHHHHADIVAGSFCSYNGEKTTPVTQPLPCGFYNKKELEDRVYDRMLYTEPFYTFAVFPTAWTKCIRRELVVQNQTDIPEKIRIGDDAALVYGCLLDADSLEIIPNNGYMYRYNDTSITHSYDERRTERCIALIEYMSTLMEKKGWDGAKQLYAYTVMIQELVIDNEMHATSRGYSGLTTWRNHPCIKRILDARFKLKMPLVRRLEFFSVRSGMFPILSLLTVVRTIRRKARTRRPHRFGGVEKSAEKRRNHE